MELEIIHFKHTGGQQEVFELAYEAAKTMWEYSEDLASLFDCEPDNIKLVFKGKVLAHKERAEEAKVRAGTVMVVVNTVKKQAKKVIASKDQVVKGAGMSTGLGASSPFGVGGYEMVNHPQYMSAISQAVDQDKMEEMMNDPQYQGMIEDMLKDPDTIRHLMNNDPMMQSMMKQNPGMKAIFQNEALLKMVFNKDTMKKTAEMMKNGNIDPEAVKSSMFGQQTTPTLPAANPFAFGQFPQQTNPLNAVNPMLGLGNTTNPFANPANPFANPANPFANLNNPYANPMNPFSMGFRAPIPPPTASSTTAPSSDQALYAKQLKELQTWGFTDSKKNLEVLRSVGGDVDLAMEKLCSQ